MHNQRCLLSSLVQPLPRTRTIVFLWCLSVASFAHAATFTVDRLDDEVTATACDDFAANDCSLRGAILTANAQPASEPSTINVPAGIYVLSQSSTCTFKFKGDGPGIQHTSSEIPLCLSKQVTIRGAGAASTIIDGNQRGRVLFVSADVVAEIHGVMIKNGIGDRSFFLNPDGGGINNQGTLTLTETVVSNNATDPRAGGATGGGIYNNGSLTLIRSTVSDNLAPEGGGILNDQQSIVTVADSVISNNTMMYPKI